ncbi:MAG: hypothetical protein IPM18_07045 [Phycisphaerales bacterium]|nr:hypothetical protein [Phycisphaerales bacterium]
MNLRIILSAWVALITLPLTASAQYVMMPDSTNSRIVLFDPFDGALVDGDFFALQGGTPVHAMQVGNEIWVSEQVGDRISRWDLRGVPLGQIGGQFPGGGLDNVRGMGLIRNVVYVTNSGTQNGAPGNAVVSYDLAGNYLGAFSTVGLAPSPFGVLEHQGAMLVSSSSANDDIHRFALTGEPLGTFHNSTALNFVEQMTYATNGDILAACFSSNNVARLDANSGALLSSFSASGARGVYQLGNGNIMWTNGSGAHVYDVNAGASALIYSGGGRYLDFLQVAPPICPGDANGDGVVNFADISPFIAALKAGSATNWTCDLGAGQGPYLNSDANGDGAVNFADISPFIALLKDPPPPCVSVCP